MGWKVEKCKNLIHLLEKIEEVGFLIGDKDESVSKIHRNPLESVMFAQVDLEKLTQSQFVLGLFYFRLDVFLNILFNKNRILHQA